MPRLAITFGIILDLLGIAGFVFTGAQHPTALIPCAFGTLILLCGIIALRVPGSRKHVMHAAATVGLLGALGGLGMGLPKIAAALDGTSTRPLAVWLQIAMGAISLVFVVLCAKSFVDARRKMGAPTPP